LRSDSDMFNRWQAAQTYATRLLLRSVASIRTNGVPAEDEAFTDALGDLIARSDADPAFAALTITLPSESDLAREIGANVDPDAIAQARRALKRAIGQRLWTRIENVYDTLSIGEARYAPDAPSAGRRAARNALLDLMIAADAARGGERASRQFERADNMTDQFGALAALTMAPGARRESALAAFYDAHADDPLVIDKWFAVQAVIPEQETLARVRALMRHAAYSPTNPNRLRALIGSFANGNPTQFNAPDGSGYEFVANIVLDLDQRNPQVAARMLGAFGAWRVLEPLRRASAEATLRKVAAVANLSADARDIVDRALA